MMRVGFGYDVHRLVEGRRLMLGGVAVPHDMGLDGHSDADVLCHAMIDAMLGAAAQGDIGEHFPSADERYRDISSLELLKSVKDEINELGWQLVNVDSTIVAQRPKLSPYIPKMRQVLGETMGASQGIISIKATTTEGLGFAGHEEGIAAYAVALLEFASPE